MAAGTHAHDEHVEKVRLVTPMTDFLGFLSRISSIALMVGLLLLPYSYSVDPTGKALLLVLKYSNFIWAIYIVIQVLESTQRDFTEVWSWVFDNLLAVIILIVSFLVLTGFLSFGGPITFDQAHLVVEAMVWDLVDLVTGLLIPIIIAGSIKSRRETVEH